MAQEKELQSKLHGEALREVIQAEHVDAMPRDNNPHGHSHAAHLQVEGNVHTAPEGIGKQGREPGAIQQPPQDPKRSGKAHARQ